MTDLLKEFWSMQLVGKEQNFSAKVKNTKRIELVDGRVKV